MAADAKSLEAEYREAAERAESHIWSAGVNADQRPVVNIINDAFAPLLARHAAAMEAVDKLQRFKDYVHKRLDDAGVPVDPESSHKAEGCRIGGRLDWVFERTLGLSPLPSPPEPEEAR